jgi:hypothetical protein
MWNDVDTLVTILTLLNTIHPLVLSLLIIGGFVYLFYLMLAKNGPIRQLSDNHLSGLPEMADTLVDIKIELRRGNELQTQLLAIASRIEGRLDR